jgi:hypothetical protein
MCPFSRSLLPVFASLEVMPPQTPAMKLREIEHGLGLLATEVESELQIKPINLLYWQRELREVIARLEERRDDLAANRKVG